MRTSVALRYWARVVCFATFPNSCKEFPLRELKPIKTDADHKKALAEIERLAILNPEAGTDDGNRLEVLATLVEAYEKKRFPIEQPTPIEAIEFRMDQLGLSRKDLEAYIGSRSKVSEVLSGKRSLTLRMIRALSKGLDIPADVLLQESLPPDPDLDWTRFPLQEMHRRGWIDSADEDRAEELMRGYLSDVSEQELIAVLCRQTNYSERSGRRMDPYAIVAWSAQMVMKAKKRTDVEKYTPGIVTPEFMRNVAQCSWSDDGPLLANEYLANQGICLVIEPHLPRTYLDGSACICHLNPLLERCGPRGPPRISLSEPPRGRSPSQAPSFP